MLQRRTGPFRIDTGATASANKPPAADGSAWAGSSAIGSDKPQGWPGRGSGAAGASKFWPREQHGKRKGACVRLSASCEPVRGRRPRSADSIVGIASECGAGMAGASLTANRGPDSPPPVANGGDHSRMRVPVQAAIMQASATSGAPLRVRGFIPDATPNSVPPCRRGGRDGPSCPTSVLPHRVCGRRLRRLVGLP